MIKTYKAAVSFIEHYIPSPDKKHPGQLGLDRMKYFMELLGNPQNTYNTIHVGGTSGKGSTATMIAHILSAQLRVGLYTSPHLERINERIKIFDWKGSDPSDGPTLCSTDIADEEFITLVDEILPYVEQVGKTQFGQLTYFEILAGMAFLYFFKRNVDIAVIEVGMGGTYDATNIIQPSLAVITNIGLDHTEILGNTVEEIAHEKAGIIKPQIPVVTGVEQNSIIQIIEETCKKGDARISILSRDFTYSVQEIAEHGSLFDYQSDRWKLQNLKLSLLGEHQVQNAALAIRAVEILLHTNSYDAGIENNTRNALVRVFIPGRLEIIQRDPIVLLDGAHNGDKATALREAIKDIFPSRHVTTILAIKSGKNREDILRELLSISNEIILTAFHLNGDLGEIVSFSPIALQKIIKRIDSSKPVLIQNDPVKALALAKQKTSKDDTILVTGSLYLVGEVRKSL